MKPKDWEKLPEVVAALTDAVCTNPHERIGQVIDNALRFFDADVTLLYVTSEQLIQALKRYADPEYRLKR